MDRVAQLLINAYDREIIHLHHATIECLMNYHHYHSNMFIASVNRHVLSMICSSLYSFSSRVVSSTLELIMNMIEVNSIEILNAFYNDLDFLVLSSHVLSNEFSIQEDSIKVINEMLKIFHSDILEKCFQHSIYDRVLSVYSQLTFPMKYDFAIMISLGVKYSSNNERRYFLCQPLIEAIIEAINCANIFEETRVFTESLFLLSQYSDEFFEIIEENRAFMEILEASSDPFLAQISHSFSTLVISKQ